MVAPIPRGENARDVFASAAQLDSFPQPGQDVGPAKRVCSRCLVLAECRTWAVEQGPELLGIWAGTSPAQRQEMRKADPRPPRAARHRVERSTARLDRRRARPSRRCWPPAPSSPSAPTRTAARAIAAAVGGDSRAVDRALSLLVEEGYASLQVGGIGADGRHHPRARYYRNLRPYVETDALTGCGVHPVEGSTTAA